MLSNRAAEFDAQAHHLQQQVEQASSTAAEAAEQVLKMRRAMSDAEERQQADRRATEAERAVALETAAFVRSCAENELKVGWIQNAWIQNAVLRVWPCLCG
jgi:hypothetical protein